MSGRSNKPLTGNPVTDASSIIALYETDGKLSERDLRVLRMVELAGPDGLSGITPETAPLLRDHAQQDWRDVVARLDVPVLMVAGRDSQFWPCEHAAAAVADNALGRAVVIEDCGHGANLDRVEEFNTTLKEFLRDL